MLLFQLIFAVLGSKSKNQHNKPDEMALQVKTFGTKPNDLMTKFV